MFLISKFTEGARVVVAAIPSFILLFVCIHAYYDRAALELGLGKVPAKPRGKRSVVIVPVTQRSRLTEHAISEALSLSHDVLAVTVMFDTGDQRAHDAQRLQE
ncbi:MAG: amino acid permease, partial [Streptosporangiaceae bacterium]